MGKSHWQHDNANKGAKSEGAKSEPEKAKHELSAADQARLAKHPNMHLHKEDNHGKHGHEKHGHGHKQ
eukprot:CAMPEP_0202889886 /NCGR_PEP_ID=MMETSP1392-20130828/430_1 /ASSEMBLY_ACC=CAM_ASM_000868 /TAXON_ID=225041 /ORGANISM="Chlamydomonas chlamydogama, Strain SAG 11-48b" /LENGTH=67 /DNA_ID=CAMNT_0049573317 /DNA_START=66 /DNA_END=269 /DNA_ORIENTATION=+